MIAIGDLAQLRRERDRLTTQIAAVERTVAALEEGHPIPENMFAGFDHTQYRAEVEERWGEQAAAAADSWWTGLDAADREQFLAEQRAIQDGFDQLLEAGGGAVGPRGPGVGGAAVPLGARGPGRPARPEGGVRCAR